MADSDDSMRTRGRQDESMPLDPNAVSELTAEDYRNGFGEDLQKTLDLSTWSSGLNLDEEYSRIEQEVEEAVRSETDLQHRIREELYPRLEWKEGPKGIGLYAVPIEELEKIHEALLFAGGVEACDGHSEVHDTLPLTIHQIGVSLVSYGGDGGTWCQRLFRRDLRLQHSDPLEDAFELLERRSRRNGIHQPQSDDRLSELAQRTIMSYAERAILLDHSKALWRMGHGSPAPLELFIGAGLPELIVASIQLMRRLIEDHQKFVFVPSEGGHRGLLTFGHALRPLEYVIVSDLRDQLYPALESSFSPTEIYEEAEWDGDILSPLEWVQRFRDEVAPKVVVGMYRATHFAPAQLFYAHQDHADIAARIALADSVLQEQRGFPLLIDMADRLCRSVYGGGTLKEMASAAFAAAEAPFEYQSERMSRDR